MSKRRLRPAAEIVSDIGALAHDLQHHNDTDIARAVTFCRTVNPEMFAWLVRALSVPVANVIHGETCPKVSHTGLAYLHAAEDDGPYDVDGVSYCGRCHLWLS